MAGAERADGRGTPRRIIAAAVRRARDVLGRIPGLRSLAARRDSRRILAPRGASPGALVWEPLPPAPLPLYDSGAAQVGNKLLVFCGYTRLDRVSSRVLVFDLDACRWGRALPTPRGMAHSHAAIATEGEGHVYVVTGQVGPQCSPAVTSSWSFDVVSGEWTSLPPLPRARYAPVAQVIDARLHVAGGLEEDRQTPAHEHWSIAVGGGTALETGWREETPIPLGGSHRAAAALDGRLYVFGGQHGDWAPVPGDLRHRCTERTREAYFPDTWMWDPCTGRWLRKADMPVAASHTETSVVVRDGGVYLLGGQVYKDPADFSVHLTDAVQAYDAARDRWETIGRLPFRVKSVVAALHRGCVIACLGQRDRGPLDHRAGEVVSLAWKARLPAQASGA